MWGNVPIYSVMMDLNPTCYFSHYTAMFLNGLTEQIPKTIFLNTEQTPKPAGFITDIEQKNIDAAFRNQAREQIILQLTQILRFIILAANSQIIWVWLNMNCRIPGL